MSALNLASAALSVAATLALASGALAQVTNHSIDVGGPGAKGCQNSMDPPTLSNGVTVATATLDYSYDAATAILTVSVSNTTPVQSGANAVICEVCFNVPAGAVTGFTLLSQTGASGATPGFFLEAPSMVGCLGTFDICLRNRGSSGCIGNPDVLTTPGASYGGGPSQVDGPAVFEFQLTGPGVHALDARTIAVQRSNSGDFVNAGLKFQGAAPGDASGFISSVETLCEPVIWLGSPAALGTTPTLYFGANEDCHGCLLGSLNPGPTDMGPLVGIPIILPIDAFSIVLTTTIDFNVGQTQLQFPFLVPNDLNLVGSNLYLTLATTNPLEFSPQFVVTIVP